MELLCFWLSGQAETQRQVQIWVLKKTLSILLLPSRVTGERQSQTKPPSVDLSSFLFFVGVCMHACVCIYMHMCGHTCGGWVAMLGVVPQAYIFFKLAHLFIELGSAYIMAHV